MKIPISSQPIMHKQASCGFYTKLKKILAWFPKAKIGGLIANTIVSSIQGVGDQLQTHTDNDKHFPYFH